MRVSGNEMAEVSPTTKFRGPINWIELPSSLQLTTGAEPFVEVNEALVKPTVRKEKPGTRRRVKSLIIVEIVRFGEGDWPDCSLSRE